MSQAYAPWPAFKLAADPGASTIARAAVPSGEWRFGTRTLTQSRHDYHHHRHTMNIEEVKAAKAKLELTITDLLKQFSAYTGIAVDSIKTDIVPRLDSSSSYVVKVEVRL